MNDAHQPLSKVKPASLNWDLLREQLFAIDAGKNFERDILRFRFFESRLQDVQSNEGFSAQFFDSKIDEVRAFEHLIYLLEENLIQGIMILRGFTEYHYGITHLRLTEKGAGVLCNIKSKKKWNEIQLKTSSRGILLTPDYIICATQQLNYYDVDAQGAM